MRRGSREGLRGWGVVRIPAQGCRAAADGVAGEMVGVVTEDNPI